MATAQVKRETLKNIGNVQDWALKQRGKDKKEVTKPVKPRSTASKQPKITKVAAHASAPVVLAVSKPPVVPQPIKEEVKEPIDNGVHTPSAGAKVRRIYSREFLIKFKYSATPFPPGAQTPLDLINQYNKEFELREQQRMAENSQASTTSVPQSSSTAAPAKVETPVPTTTTTTEKKVKKTIKKEGEEKHFKLRLGTTDESLLRSPLFRASATKARHQTPPSSATIKGDDKENPVPVKSVRSSSVKRQAESPAPVVTKKETKKAPKLPIPSSAAPTPAPTAAPAPSIDSFAVPITIAEPTPAPAPAAVEAAVVAPAVVAPVDAVMTDDASKQDLVDVLSKKLKNALRETDPRRLAQRQKQIDYGKATAGYQDYCKQTPKSKRKREDPKTPNKYQVCSKRSWDGQIRKWRRMLHMYDPVELKEAQAKNPTDEDIDMVDGKPFSFEITAADLLAEEKALLE